MAAILVNLPHGKYLTLIYECDTCFYPFLKLMNTIPMLKRQTNVIKDQIKSLKVIWIPITCISIMVSAYLRMSRLIERFDFFLTFSFVKSTFSDLPPCAKCCGGWNPRWPPFCKIFHMVDIWHHNIWVWHVFLAIFGTSEQDSDDEKANKGHIRSLKVKLRVQRSSEAQLHAYQLWYLFMWTFMESPSNMLYLQS